MQLLIDLSVAAIKERHWTGDDYEEVEHFFSALVTADPQDPTVNSMPFYSGMGIQVSVSWLTLFRIAKVVLADEPDPLPALAARVMAAS